MAKAKDYQKQVGQVLGTNWGKKMKLQWNYNTPEEAQFAIKDIRLKQKTLRQVKRDINAELKYIRQVYSERAAKVGSGSGLSGLFMGKQKAIRMKADQKRKIKQEKDKKIAPYNQVKLVIDQAITKMDGVKLDAEKKIAEQN